MLVPDGGMCVFVHATTHEGVPGDDVLPHPRPPREAIASLVRDYLGPLRRAGRGVLPQGTLSGEGDIFRAAGFQEPTRLDVAGGLVVERSADETVASVFSLSSAAPTCSVTGGGAFERDLRGLLRETSATGRSSERTRDISSNSGDRHHRLARAPAGASTHVSRSCRRRRGVGGRPGTRCPWG
ncbi:hypothetical protein [Parafrankia sp. BMG5.11]|nr:hypothetical protein [Parafrankia sp. BMG5.11]